MTFRILANSTTADASDVNDNYYHIGQGSILPMGGSTLSEVDATYNLGSDTYKWLRTSAHTIASNYFDSAGRTWRFISRSTVNTATSRIDISGVSKANDKEYLFKFMFITETSTSTQIGLFYDNNSAGSDYRCMYINAADATLTTYVTGPSADGMILCDTSAATTTSRYHFGHFQGRNMYGGVIMEDVGEVKMSVLRSGSGVIGGSSWTSFQVVSTGGNMETDSYFEVWAKDA